MFKIGEFSKICKTTIRTLRYYDDIGLFKPSFVDENGYRYYEYNQINDLLRIIEYRALDLPIESIIEIFKNGNEKEILSNHIRYLENEKKKKTYQIASLKKMIEGENENMNYQASFKTIPENYVYYRHGTIESLANMTDFVFETGRRCQELNPTIKCKDYCYITYTAKEYKEKDVELEYAEAVENKGNEGNEVFFRKDPEIYALCVQHKGSYLKLRDAYAFALNQIEKENLKITGPIREVYIHGCWDCESEDDYLTEIQVPISK